ncbi:hypothetical protein Glove_300g34 [Diversispora epigaea]|uniref:Uncharacterized protein n=1 Tax=Diversispora epigaea TaxID=1348612 RepID=A0A397I1G7_9GLOM|nr:hypothetical protein Glove_300g34 [Diversispora epigaea]
MPAFPHKLEYNIHIYIYISFEECAIRLHHQYEINKGMFCLFTNKKNNPKERFEALREIIKIENNNKNNKVFAYKNYMLNIPMDVGKTCLNRENDLIRKERNPTHVLLSKFIPTIGRRK